MKVRKGFVSNSSSTAFIITNRTKEFKDLMDFVAENPQLIKEFKREYDWYKDDPKFTQENLLISAKENNYVFSPAESKQLAFGDEDGTLIGHVFDYILRGGGKSESFSWKFHKWLR